MSSNTGRKEVILAANLASLLRQELNLIASLEDKLKTAKARARDLAENMLPEAMSAADMSAYLFPDGTRVELKEELHASIPADRREEAMSWLRETGNDDLIKNEVTLSFPKGADVAAETFYTEVLKTISAQQRVAIEVTRKDTIHGSTLKAFLKRMLESGENFPISLFGVYAPRKAVIIEPAPEQDLVPALRQSLAERQPINKQTLDDPYGLAETKSGR